MQPQPSHKLPLYPKLKVFASPRDADETVKVRFKAVGRAPILVEAKQLGQIGSDQKFGTLANHLRRQLKLKGSESLVPSFF